MVWDIQDANNIYRELRDISAKILTKIDCYTEPHSVNGRGRTRTCSWRPIGGEKRFRGVLYHYTNGVVEIGTMCWANHPGWGNEGSSWHVTVMDRISDNIVGEIWIKIDDEIRRLFPVPTVIMADWHWGTWHGNWTCGTTLGVENRNGGYHGYNKAKGGLKGLGKEGVRINNRVWEPYTREQIVANINIGRLANGWIGGQLDRDWVLTHQCVWGSKMDCGLAYPIHDIRSAVFTDQKTTELKWLGAHPMAPDTVVDDDGEWLPLDEFRFEAEKDYIRWVVPTPEVEEEERNHFWVASQLYKLGFNTGPELPTTENLRKQVRWFQRSTGAFRKSKPKRVLVPDGIVGSKTYAEIVQRLKTFNIV
jgi:hypothetical protein